MTQRILELPPHPQPTDVKQKNANKAREFSSGVLGAAVPKGLGRSPYKICELDLSSLKANKNLEFLGINLEFLEIASLRSQ